VIMAEAVLEEICEFEMSSTEVDELRGVLEDVLVSSGKFSIEDIDLWLDSFDKCEIDEHRHGLIYWAHKFIESGEEQDEQVSDLMETNLLSKKEEAEIQMKIQSMDYKELVIFTEVLRGILREAEKLEKEKIRLQKNRDLSVEQRTILIKEFESSTINDRKKMVRKLPVIVAEFKRRNQVERTTNEIRRMINRRQTSEARALLNSSVMVGDVYRELEARVSAIEIDKTREFLLAA